MKDIGGADPAGAAADHVEIDDGVFPIVGELGQGEAENIVIGGAAPPGGLR